MHRILQYDSSTPTRIDTLLVQRARMPTSRSTHVCTSCVCMMYVHTTLYTVYAYYTRVRARMHSMHRRVHHI